jgi:tetratricopeptide (TPR) repeat protein
MQKTIFSSLLFTFLTLSVFAQNGSWGEFPMVPNNSFHARRAAANKIKDTPAYYKALAVYERLREARGDHRYPVPAFYMTQKETVAEISYGENVIYLSEKAFKVCESFGRDSEAAIAFLLGHELTHYYEKHAWRSNFSMDYSELSLVKEIDSTFNVLVKNAADPATRKLLMRFDTLLLNLSDASMEAQSDYLGGFLAYSAGYGAFRQGDELIKRLYTEFGIPEQTSGYMTRSERQNLSRRSAEQLQNLVEVFEMANMLTAVGQYEDAYRYYRTVLSEYQSREVYNNVGATALLQALKLFKAEEVKFRYPVQLDLEMANTRGAEEEEQRKKLLRQAIQHFDAAISLDPNYAPAYLNKACALALLGDPIRARYYADVEARRAATGKYAGSLPSIEILLGILDAESGTEEGKEKAKARFSAAAQNGANTLANYNLAVLQNQSPPAAPTEGLSFFDEETIDGKAAAGLLYPEEDKMLQIDETITFHQNTKQGKHSRLYFNRRGGKTNIVFLATTTDYPGETARGIKINAARAEVEKQYGPAPRSIMTTTGELLVYPDVLFVMKNDQVEKWVLVKKF